MCLSNLFRVFDEGQERQNSANQNVIEDPGYFTCISDSSSKSSHVLISKSDISVRKLSVVIKDTVMLGSSGQDPVPNGDTSVCVLVSGQCGDAGSAQSNEPSDADLIFQLDTLLSDEGASLLDDMDICETQEVVTYEDEEEILRLEPATDCQKKLQQRGRITRATHLVEQVRVCVRVCSSIGCVFECVYLLSLFRLALIVLKGAKVKKRPSLLSHFLWSHELSLVARSNQHQK